MPFGSNFGSKTAPLANPLSGFGFWAWYFSNYLQLCNNRQDEHPIRQHYTRAQFWEQYLMFISLMDPVKEGKMGQAWDHETCSQPSSSFGFPTSWVGGWQYEVVNVMLTTCAVVQLVEVLTFDQLADTSHWNKHCSYICIYICLLFHFTQHPPPSTLWLNNCIFPFKYWWFCQIFTLNKIFQINIPLFV